MDHWMLLAALAVCFFAMGWWIDRTIYWRFGHRRVISAIVLQNIVAVFPLAAVALLVGVPPSADQMTLVWVNLGVVGAIVSIVPYLKSFTPLSMRYWLWRAVAVVLTCACAFLFYLATKTIGPVGTIWLLESGFFGAAIVMLIVYPRAIGSLKAASNSPRGRIILLELARGLCGQLFWVSVVIAFADLIQNA